MSSTMRSRHLPRVALAVLGVAAGLGLTACGPSTGGGKAGLADLSGPEIFDRAAKAMKSADSLTTDLDGIIDGGPMKYRMTSDTKGECAGTMSMDGGTIQLIKTGDTVYTKYDEAFWKAQGKDGETVAKVVGDRWTIEKASSADAKDLTAFCDLDGLLSGIETGDTAVEKGKTTTVDGQSAITLTEKDGAETYTIYVATTGKPYILKIVTKGGKEPGTTSFSDFDKPVPAKAPAAKDTVDLNKLGG